MTNYIQCRLSKNGKQQVAWIEERGAVPGKMVELKEDGTFWHVEAAYHGVKLPYDVVNERSQDYKKTRKASDI